MAKIVKFTMNQTSEQLAYLAGIIDGEGCFYFGKGDYSPTITHSV